MFDWLGADFAAQIKELGAFGVIALLLLYYNFRRFPAIEKERKAERDNWFTRLDNVAEKTAGTNSGIKRLESTVIDVKNTVENIDNKLDGLIDFGTGKFKTK